MPHEQATLPAYEVYAIRYSHMDRLRRDNFIGGDPHEGPMPMDFFVWLLRSEERTVLVDTGFNAATAATRGRSFLHCPIESLQALDIRPENIQDVILTHLHYDHAGNLDKLPSARFHIQDAEVGFATGRCMCEAFMRHAYSVEDVVTLIRKLYDDRVVFHDGDAALFPGIQLMKIGGHTKGLQAVRVHTAKGWLVLASDASHYYENLQSRRPFPIAHSIEDMLSGYARLQAAASSEAQVIPGHDPLVMQRFPTLASQPDIVILHGGHADADSPSFISRSPS